ncbi:MAG: 50S ribosomal protein L35 [Planctomycetota bacterium]
MPKLKTRKAVSKRIKITARGKLKHNQPGRRHLLQTKTAKRKRQLRKQEVLRPKALIDKFKSAIPYA